MRKRSVKNKDYDQNIIDALKKLPVPLKTFDGHNVLFDEDKRKETIYEHIAIKSHHLHVVDILVVPRILLNKNCLKNDKNGVKFRNYVGIRGKKVKNQFIFK